jgi:hypothetical protein
LMKQDFLTPPPWRQNRILSPGKSEFKKFHHRVRPSLWKLNEKTDPRTGLYFHPKLSGFHDSDSKQAQMKTSPRRSQRTRRNQDAEELTRCCTPGGQRSALRRQPPGMLEVLLRALRGLRGEIWFFVRIQCATFDFLVDARLASPHCLNRRSCFSLRAQGTLRLYSKES